MKKIETLTEKFKQLRLDQKIECIAAFFLSLFLLIAIPAYAWFAQSKAIETLTKVKAPPALDIRAGREEAIKNFELREIDIKQTKDNGGKSYVFCVKSGEEDATYKIQLAHTTNIPIKYSLYPATEVDKTTADTLPRSDVAIYTLEGTDTDVYYRITDGAQAITLNELNPEDEPDEMLHGRNLAKNAKSNYYYGLSYNNSDDPQIYAIPKYSQSAVITSGSANYDYFILKLEWAGHAEDTTQYAKWNKAENNKETDIIYISASRTNG